MGLFDRFKKALAKTREAVTGSLFGVFRGALDEDKIEEIEDALLSSDVGVKTTEALVDALRTAWKKRELTDAADARPFLMRKLQERLSDAGNEIRWSSEKPTVILVVGVNGSGKTTSIAKLTRHLHEQGHKIVLGAGDTFRAAAVEQLTVWSRAH